MMENCCQKEFISAKIENCRNDHYRDGVEHTGSLKSESKSKTLKHIVNPYVLGSPKRKSYTKTMIKKEKNTKSFSRT